jgi:hypothetical protein
MKIACENNGGVRQHDKVYLFWVKSEDLEVEATSQMLSMLS